MSPDTPSQSPGTGAEARALAGLVDYQTGAVVSHEIISRKGGSVTVFAFDAGQGLSEHSAPFDALLLVIDGRAEVTISGRPYTVGAGEIIVMPAHEPHALRALVRFKMMLVMIRG